MIILNSSAIANAEMYKCQSDRGFEYQQVPCKSAVQSKEIGGNVTILPEYFGGNKNKSDAKEMKATIKEGKERQLEESQAISSEKEQEKTRIAQNNGSPLSITNSILSTPTPEEVTFSDCGGELVKKTNGRHNKYSQIMKKCGEITLKDYIDRSITNELLSKIKGKIIDKSDVIYYLDDSKKIMESNEGEYYLLKILLIDYGLSEQIKGETGEENCLVNLVGVGRGSNLLAIVANILIDQDQLKKEVLRKSEVCESHPGILSKYFKFIDAINLAIEKKVGIYKI